MTTRRRSIGFRCDFGPSRGWGHVVRCAALAEEAKRRSWHCQLMTTGDAAHLAPDVRAAFAEILAVSPGELFPDPPGGLDWLVVDHYDAADATIVRLARQSRLLVIDDLAERALGAAGVVLNSRLGLRTNPGYAPGPRLLLGESYAPLRPGFRPSAHVRPAGGYCLILPGGTDAAGITAPVLEALAIDTIKRIPVLVLSRHAASAPAAAARLANFPESIWVEALSAAELAGWMRRAVCGVTSCGSSIYEFGYMRLPFIGVIAAANQALAGEAVSALWRCPVLPRMELTAERIVRALATLAEGKVMFDHAPIDASGAARVIDALEGD